MSSFIETDEGWINRNFVVSMRYRYRDGGARYAEVTYIEGKDVRTARTPDDPDVNPMTTIAASPGYHVVQMVGPAPYELISDPVIAWRVDCSHPLPYVHPVRAGIGFVAEPDGHWGVLMPNGEVHGCDEEIYASIEEFKQAQKLLPAAKLKS